MDIILKIYEIQNTGKGVIAELPPENLLKIFDSEIGLQGLQGLEQVLTRSSILTGSHSISVQSQLYVGSADNYVRFLKEYLTSTSSPGIELKNKQGATEAGILIYPDKFIAKDTIRSKGIEYGGDYEANFTARSLITKQYLTQILASNVINQQKVLIYPTDFPAGKYTLTNADNNYTIFVNNGSNNVTIELNTSVTTPNFCVGFIQEGTADVTFVGTGVTLTNPIGMKSKGQGYQTFIERELATSNYYLLGNTRA